MKVCALLRGGHTCFVPFLSLTLSLPRAPKIKIQDRSQVSFCNLLNSFEWSHHRISSRLRSWDHLNVSITDSGSERVNYLRTLSSGIQVCGSTKLGSGGQLKEKELKINNVIENCFM